MHVKNIIPKSTVPCSLMIEYMHLYHINWQQQNTQFITNTHFIINKHLITNTHPTDTHLITNTHLITDKYLITDTHLIAMLQINST